MTDKLIISLTEEGTKATVPEILEEVTKIESSSSKNIEEISSFPLTDYQKELINSVRLSL